MTDSCSEVQGTETLEAERQTDGTSDRRKERRRRVLFGLLVVLALFCWYGLVQYYRGFFHSHGLLVLVNSFPVAAIFSALLFAFLEDGRREVAKRSALPLAPEELKLAAKPLFARIQAAESAKAELSPQQFQTLKSWAEMQNYPYQGVEAFFDDFGKPIYYWRFGGPTTFALVLTTVSSIPQAEAAFQASQIMNLMLSKKYLLEIQREIKAATAF